MEHAFRLTLLLAALAGVAGFARSPMEIESRTAKRTPPCNKRCLAEKLEALTERMESVEDSVRTIARVLRFDLETLEERLNNAQNIWEEQSPGSVNTVYSPYEGRPEPVTREEFEAMVQTLEELREN